MQSEAWRRSRCRPDQRVRARGGPLEAIADHAHCSVHSLYATFGGRDELLRALFERHSPLLDIEDFFDGDHGDLRTTVRRLYWLITQILDRAPRVTPAMLAEALARPDSPAAQNLLRHNAPRLLARLGGWLTAEVQAGRLCDVPLLIQQLVAPIAIHMLLRPVTPQIPGIEMPNLDTVCDTFTDTFLHATAATTSTQC
jgi:AcrR family transcriptional regulator